MELELDAKKTALVVVDLQRGILALPAAPHSAIEVVERAAALCRAARGAEERAFAMRTVFPRIGRVRERAEVLAALEG